MGLHSCRHSNTSRPRYRYATVSEDGTRVVAVADNHTVHVWDVQTGALITARDDVPDVDWALLKNQVVRFVPKQMAGAAPPGRALPFPNLELPVSKVVVNDNDVWLLTPRIDKEEYDLRLGPAYRVQGDVARAYPNDDSSVTSVVQAHGQTWLKTGTFMTPGPVYRVEDEWVRPFPGPNFSVNHLEIGSDDVWIGTNFGAYRLAHGKLSVAGKRRLKVRRIRRLGTDLWLATAQGAYRFDGKRMVRVTDSYLGVTDVREAGERTWLITGSGSFGFSSNGPAYRVDHDTAVRIGEVGSKVSSVEQMLGQTWLLMDRGVARLEGEVAVPIRGITRPPGRITEIDRADMDRRSACGLLHGTKSLRPGCLA